MPLQNRVTPHGEFIATKERGTMMGSRGVLHEDKQIIRKSGYNGWITCLLNFQNIRREVMSERGYTELFFLDEATAFAAGHRPCFECQRKRFNEFKNAWVETNAALYGLDNPYMPEIDKVLHKERIHKQGKVTYQDSSSNVSNGAFIEHKEKAYLKWDNRYFEWTAGGYVSAIKIHGNQQVKVLTPKSIVRCFKNGFIPKVHDSVQKF